MKIKKIIKSRLFIFFAFLLVAFIFFGKWFFLTGENRRYLAGDFYYYFSSFYFYVESIKNHTLPLWNQYVYQGTPTIARADSPFFYPVNLAFILIASALNLSFTKLYLFYELYPVVHLALGGFFTFLLSRDFKISMSGSFLAGLIFMFSGSLVVMVSAPVLLGSLVWFPLILLYFRRILSTDEPYLRKKYILITILVMAISHFGGYFQISFYYNIFGLLLYLVYWSFAEKKSIVDFWLQIKHLVIIVAASVLLYAVQFLPTLELAMHSTRASISLETATLYGVVKPLDFLNFVYPNFYRYISNGLLINLVPIYTYFGFLTILLLMFGLKSQKRNVTGYFVLLLIIASLAVMGGYAGFYDYLVMLIPGLIKFRNIFKILYLASISVAVISALGFDYIFSITGEFKGKVKGTIKYFVFLMMTVMAFQVLIFSYRFLSHQKYNNDIFAIEAVGNSITLSLVFILISIILVYYGALWKKLLLKILIILVIFIDLATFNQFNLINNSKINARDFLLGDNVEVINLIRGDSDIFRVKFVGTGFGSYYFPEGLKIRNVDGYSSFVIDKFGEATTRVNGLPFDSQDFIAELSNAGVKYVISDQKIQNPNLLLVHEDTVTVENQKYYYVLADEAHNYLKRSPGGKIYLYQNQSFRGMIDSQAGYKIEEFSDKEIKVSVNADSDQNLTIKVPFYNGWKAYLDSKPVKIDKNNQGYISLDVPKGKSTLILKFVPSYVYYLGLAITLLILISIGLYYFLLVRPYVVGDRPKKRKRSAS